MGSSWSEACWLPAACVVHPGSRQDVAKALLIVTFLQSRFAVRGGGHNPNVGFASIHSSGVLIVTTKLNEVTLSEDKTVVRVRPGNLFRDVYHNADLLASGKTIVGGRTDAVGVGGYYLGGGIAFFSNKYGISASQVRNFEASNIPLACLRTCAASYSDSNSSQHGVVVPKGGVGKFNCSGC